jgi:hypothetical protein
MGNKVIIKDGTSKELCPQGSFYPFSLVDGIKILYLDLALLKATSKLSEDGKRKL